METTLEKQLRDAVKAALASGWSMNALAKAAGVSRSAIRDWYFKTRGGLSLETGGKLAVWFGTELKKPKIPKVSK